MVERLDQSRLRAWTALLGAHSLLVRRLDADLQTACGISLVEYEVLLRLTQAPERRLRLNHLVEHARMTKSGVTRLVQRMEQAGVISTQRCSSDRRGAYACLTPAGHSTFRRAAALHLRGVQEHFGSRLSDDEAAILGRALETIATALNARGAVPEPGAEPSPRPPRRPTVSWDVGAGTTAAPRETRRR